MAEVFSTGVAMEFAATGNKKKEKNVKAADNKKPKLSAEELAAKFRAKLENVVAHDGGQCIEFIDGTGILVAGAMQKKRFYFVWLDRDRKLRFTDSKETFHIVKEIPLSLSITDYLLRNEAQCLRDIIEDFFKREEEINADDKYTLVGKINLGPRADIDNRDARKARQQKNKKKDGNANQQKSAEANKDGEQAPKKKRRNRNRNKNKNSQQQQQQ